MPAFMRQHPLVSSLIVIVIALLIAGFWPEPIPVETAPVVRATMSVTIEEEGRTRVIDRYLISAPVSGFATRLNHEIGDPIKKDQALLYLLPLTPQALDPRARAQAEAQVAAAEAMLAAARVAVDAALAAKRLADAELGRVEALLEQGLIASDEVDQARTEAVNRQAAWRSSQFSVDVARYELQARRTSLARYTTNQADAQTPSSSERLPVLAPVDGVILQIQHECEGPVSLGDPLLTVGDPTALEVEVDLLSADAVKVTPGMPVEFYRWGGDGLLTGSVKRVEPVGFTKFSALGVEEQRVLVIIDLTSPRQAWQRLGDGYRVEARFILWRQDDVLQVPSSSLFRYQQGWAAFVFDNGTARRRMLVTGRRNGLSTEVLQGLAAGERVIIHPVDAIDDGVSVTRQLPLEI